MSSNTSATPWWSQNESVNFAEAASSAVGLTSAEADKRLKKYGLNTLTEKDKFTWLSLVLRQISSPIVLILIGAAILSFSIGDPTDGSIILVIVGASSFLGFWQEYRAASAVAKLQQMVAVQAEVVRDGIQIKIPISQLVPGDVILLSAGSSVPADCRLIELKDLFVNEASLTGETFPVEKSITTLAPDTPLAKVANSVFQGTHVVSGTGRALVIQTGSRTQFGAIAQRLKLKPEETDFEHGVRSFGNLLVRITLVLTFIIFGLNVFLAKPVLDSFLFALALAVGLTPELLPAIISVNLASGARRMLTKKVIVKRLVSIENFGSMDLLCSDKTGTLTEGKMILEGAVDYSGATSDVTSRFAAMNARFQSAFHNPMDDAIKTATAKLELNAQRLDEIPYDFTRKRLSVLVSMDGTTTLVTKGAVPQMLEACTEVLMPNGTSAPIANHMDEIKKNYGAFSARGLRTICIASKTHLGRQILSKSDEFGMTLIGFLIFADPPKPGIAHTIQDLKSLGVRLKVITGDNCYVAAEISRQIGMIEARIISGPELRLVGDDAMPQTCRNHDIFAEVEPNQKERIILALRKSGHVVGYLGDGINDAPALHAADVGLSVQGAVDVAKDAADIVLMEPDLAVLVAGIREGRRTFANTMKYVFMATSANFGNMFSMAGASLLLPFLPLLPKQILLTNLITDLPEMAIATDLVPDKTIQSPQRWDMKFIFKFMIRFGLLSSVFDFITFGVLYYLLHASPTLFRTGWFVESVVSASMVVLVVRTRGPFWKNAPSKTLLFSTIAVVMLTIAIPYTPVGPLLGFAPLPWTFNLIMGSIVLTYVGCAEILKYVFFKKTFKSIVHS